MSCETLVAHECAGLQAGDLDQQLRHAVMAGAARRGFLKGMRLAMEKGVGGRRYLLGACNMTLREYFARLERVSPPAPVARLELELSGASPATGQQLPLFVPQALRGARLAWQLARLALTYGEDRVRRIEITDPEAPLPEQRWAWHSVAANLGPNLGPPR